MDDDFVWILHGIGQDSRIGWHAFAHEYMARHNAERIVGNRSYAHPNDEMSIYGPGDGTATVMVRKVRRSVARRIFPDLDLPTE